MRQKEAEKKRMLWVDYAKCFSICLVVSFHCPNFIDGFVGEVIRVLRMPAFFMIAGFLFRQEKYSSLPRFFRHRSIQLLVPYVSFFLFFYVLWAAFGRQWIGGDDLAHSVYMPLLEFVSGTPGLVNATFWFICCLFSIQMIYYVLAMLVRNKAILMLIAMLCPLLANLDIVWQLPWNIGNALLYLPYYAFANQGKAVISSLSSRHLPWVVAAFAVSLALLASLHLLPGFLRNVLTATAGILMLPLYIVAIKGLAHYHFLPQLATLIGKNTIVILAFQNYIIGAIKLLVPSVYASDIPMLNPMTAILVVMLCLIPTHLINRYAPWMIGRGHFFEKQLQRI